MGKQPTKQGMVLDKVVLLGRTLEEYRRYFALPLEEWRGRKILDVASGVSSFRAEAAAAGLEVTAFDPIYSLPPDVVQARCEPDLDHVIRVVEGLKTYKWDFYKDPQTLRTYRERAYRIFLEDYRKEQGRCYVAGSLPHLPFPDRTFDLTLVSYLMFVYEDQLDYEFHKASVVEILRVTRGEARFYPLVTFEAQRSSYLDRLRSDPDLSALEFAEVQTDFEFLVDSNWYLRVSHRRC